MMKTVNECMMRRRITYLCYWTFFSTLLHIAALLFQSARGFTMLSGASVVFRRLTDHATLNCTFKSHTFSHFENPLVWTKEQHGEEEQVNIGRTINHPFAETGRYSVHFRADAPLYHFILNLRSVTLAETGNYTCAINGAAAVVLAHVTHQLMVQVPVQQMFLTNSNVSDPLTAPSRLHYIEGQASTLRCLVSGSYPAPSATITVGQRDVSDDLTWRYNLNMTGVKGLRQLSYTLDRGSHVFVAESTDDGTDAVCHAAVPGLTARAFAITVTVQYAPKVSCEDQVAYQGQRNVTLVCVVRARPRPLTLNWRATRGGAGLIDVMVSTAFTSTTKVLNDTALLAMLHVSKVGARRFTTYVLEARNSRGSTWSQVTLKEVWLGTPWPVTTVMTAPPRHRGGHYVFIISASASSLLSPLCCSSVVLYSVLQLLCSS